MADVRTVYTSSALIYTGKGQLVGVVITSTSGTSTTATFYDNTAGSGTKILECHVSNLNTVDLFFADRYAPRFNTGLYLALGSNLTATVWTRQI
jgi:3-dehydroquinate dehydratase